MSRAVRGNRRNLQQGHVVRFTKGEVVDGADGRVMNRRGFVKRLAGAGAGVAVAGPLLNAASARAATAIPLTVGVMVPTGSNYGLMGRSLVEGLSLGFDAGRTGAVPVSATIVQHPVTRGYGDALGTAKSLLDSGSDVVVAGISSLVAQQIAPLFAERQAPLIVTNVGAHVIPPNRRSPYVFYNSLLYWQASYAMGRWAAAALAKTGVSQQAFVASALSDSGYDTVYAFRLGFESAGGTIVDERVTHVDPVDSGVSDLMNSVKSSGAKVLYGLYSGAHAAEFVQASASSGAKLAAGSLTVEDYMLPGLGSSAAGAYSCASWSATRSSPANLAFMKAFKARYRRTADPFAALGYDTAVLIVQGVRQAVQRRVGLRQFTSALSGFALEGPRGTLTLDPATNMVMSQLMIRQVKQTPSGLANVEVGKAPGVAPLGILAALGGATPSGYINEYLCA
ncbi:MAG: branched-chain amino acid transport system substrate-binding protein [Gaiellaceae bacterium]|nr:branched-chain amino acid transport system substrate-binding protein [Gaiellaceae bacterium]